jgi:hypothetical protein
MFWNEPTTAESAILLSYPVVVEAPLAVVGPQYNIIMSSDRHIIIII